MATICSRRYGQKQSQAESAHDKSAFGESVRLRSDYRLSIQPSAEDESAGICRIRIYEPLDSGDHYVVLVEEVSDNVGPSTTNAMESILSDVFTAHRSVIDIETTLVFEYLTRSVQPGIPERLDRVVISGWRVRHMPFSDRTSSQLGGIEITEVEWVEFDRDSFEILVGSTP